MFKSKPNTHHYINMSTPYTSGSGCEERGAPEPKPRWSPRPEQIRILEAIFNSGMVNPPRDEIRKIRAQLQEYGQVGDANVFYWFQNRKSRSKQKQRQLNNSSKSSSSSSSSSSSDKSSSNDKSISVMDMLNSPTASVNQAPFLQDSNEFLFQTYSQGLCFPEVVDQNLLGELMLMNHFNSKKDSVGLIAGNSAPQQFTVSPIASPLNQILQDLGPTKPTVFINDVCLEVGSEPFNVREAFGNDAILVQSCGQPVLTNEWGVTLQPLQHGAFYYLLRPSATLNLV